MITSIIVHRCPHCNSEDICRNGHDYKGAQKYHCHRCKSYGTLHARQGYREEEKELILRAYQERASMRGVERIFGTVRQTLPRWIQEKAAKLPAMEATLLAAEPDDVLELDELWSFVRTKRNQRWSGLPSVVEPDRSSPASSATAAPTVAWLCASSSPKATALVVPAATSGRRINWPSTPQRTAPWARKAGETAHVERWNNTLRQRLARFVRKTLAFSKSDHFHNAALKLFIHDYNLQCLSVTM